MSARAASRLATLGFTDVYRYQSGKADWFAAGLPREGAEAHVPRVADVAKRDVPTCALHERVSDLQDRVRAARQEISVVLDSEHIVLGIVEADALSGDPAAVVESIMKPDPVTFRPHLRTGEIPDYVRKRQVRHALVTTSDGVLIGLLPDA
jgi:Mg/Co/Ni transporter MgtE